MSALPRRWYTAGTNAQLWATHGSYNPVAFDDLPPIDRRRHDGSFGWLAAQPACYGLQFGPDEDDQPDDDVIAERLDAILEAAAPLGVPSAFGALMSREVFGRVPTCTACYVDLPTRVVAIPGQPGAMLRFLNDQQYARVWGLHLRGDGGHAVVTARPRFRDEPLEGDSLEDAAELEDFEICADDLEEFIHRFWLENVLWDVANRARALTAEEAAYLAHAQARRGA